MTVEQLAQKLRKHGFTYREIGTTLGIHASTAWKFCNRKQMREHWRDSAAKYRKRGYTALADMEPHQQSTSQGKHNEQAHKSRP